MRFVHIHSSSLHTKPGANLEAFTDKYYDECSLVTLTEVRHPDRLNAVREKGWGVVGIPKDSSGVGDCTLSYRRDTWTAEKSRALKITPLRYRLKSGKTAIPLWVATATLKHKQSGHRLLVSAGHMPPSVGSGQGWAHVGDAWEGRKKAYMDGMKNWNTWVTNQIRIQRPDAVLVTADWNLGLNREWVQNYMHNVWKTSGLKPGWKKFSGPGTFGNRFIDGVYYRGLTTDGTFRMKEDASSDHSPIKTVFDTVAKPKTPLKPEPTGGGTTPPPDPPPGSVYHGEEWWGFGDYEDDEIYHIPLN